MKWSAVACITIPLPFKENSIFLVQSILFLNAIYILTTHRKPFCQFDMLQHSLRLVSEKSLPFQHEEENTKSSKDIPWYTLVRTLPQKDLNST